MRKIVLVALAALALAVPAVSLAGVAFTPEPDPIYCPDYIGGCNSPYDWA